MKKPAKEQYVITLIELLLCEQDMGGGVNVDL